MQRSSTATFGGLHQRNGEFTILAATSRQSSLPHDATSSTPTGPPTRSATTLLVTGETSDPTVNTFRAAQSAQTRTPASAKFQLVGRSQSIACMGTVSPASTSRRRQRSDEPQMGPSVSEQVRTFRKVRDDEERDWFNKLVAIAFSMAAVALMLMILAVILRMWLNHTTIGHMMWPWGILFLACSLVLLSFCPLDEIDIDEVLQDRPVLRLSVAIAASGIQVLMGFATQPHYYYFVAALPPVALILPPGTNTRCLCCSLRMPSATIVFGLYLAGERFASTLARVHAAHAAGGETGTLSGIDLPGECWWALACVCVAGSLMTIGVVAFWARRLNGHMSLAVLLSKALYCHFSMIGIDGLVLGTMVQIYTTDRLVGAVLLLGGAVFVMPLLIIVFAPAQLFEMPQKRFDNDMNRAQRDGAFIAGLTDGTQVSAGQVWWIHRPDGEEDYSFEPFDHRHHWRKGLVTDTSPLDFTVEVPEGWRRLQTRRPGSADGLEKVDSAVKRVPLGARNRPWDELVKEAQKRLRCIEWKNITEELIASGVVCGVDDENLNSNGYYELSRAAQPGEIDYFMSHSWHDDAQTKWAALQKVVEVFKKKHGREPTFWLDKACIDQENLVDALRVLPVNVMACRRVLVLCGETYTQRLWCIWELFTLMAFASMGQALERLHVVPLHASGAADSTIQQLTDFTVDEAHCYDPNEERQLKRIIEGLGKNQFNERVRELGNACLTADSSVDEEGILRYRSRKSIMQRCKDAARAVRRCLCTGSFSPDPGQSTLVQISPPSPHHEGSLTSILTPTNSISLRPTSSLALPPVEESPETLSFDFVRDLPVVPLVDPDEDEAVEELKDVAGLPLEVVPYVSSEACSSKSLASERVHSSKSCTSDHFVAKTSDNMVQEFSEGKVAVISLNKSFNPTSLLNEVAVVSIHRSCNPTLLTNSQPRPEWEDDGRGWRFESDLSSSDACDTPEDPQTMETVVFVEETEDQPDQFTMTPEEPHKIEDTVVLCHSKDPSAAKPKSISEFKEPTKAGIFSL